MILGIDASTPGSGGAKRHLIELLKIYDVSQYPFNQIKVWGVKSLLDELPNNENLVKITHPLLNGNFMKRTLWQIFYRDKAIKNECNILFCPFGTYTGNIRPYVSMSRNMLIFDENERKRFGISWMRLKLKILFYIQKLSFSKASGIIFLSNHAKTKVQEYVNIENKFIQIIHHGISQSFDYVPKKQHAIDSYNNENPYNFLYVSTIWIYKHPWNVVQAIKNLRDAGYPVILTIVGNTEQKSAGIRLENVIKQVDPQNKFIFWQQKVGLNEVFKYYKKSDAFIFASTCENMPNILIEAMASGLPIACSSFPPMPEFLKDSGIYFDPTDIKSIEDTIKILIRNAPSRENLANKSYNYSKDFNWRKCADETFSFLYNICSK